MKISHMALATAGMLSLAACATKNEPLAPAPPVGAGAIVGTVAADRDGDGYVDGYYSSDGLYHAVQGPPCPPPPPPPSPSRSGERG